MANVLARLGGRKRSLVGIPLMIACTNFNFAYDEDLCVAGRRVSLDD